MSNFSINEYLASLLGKIEAKIWSDRYEILSKTTKVLKDLIFHSSKLIEILERDSEEATKHFKSLKKTFKLC